MKHTLQWKFIAIMFTSLVCGVTAMAVIQAIVYGKLGGMTAEEAEEAAENYTVLFDILFIAVTTIVFLLLSRKVIRRIELMNHNVEQITSGNMKELSQDYKRDELGSLSRNINSMAKTISDSLDKEREMVCNVAHDLRTPVTSIRGYAKLLQDDKELSEESRQYISIIANKSTDLSEQIGELLEYSVLQFEEKEYQFEKLSLSKLIEQVLVEFIPQLDEENMTFTYTGNQKTCEVECNQILMVRMFENLFTNCIRYGKKGKSIDVRIDEADGQCRIEISDYGISLSQEEAEHLFEPFYQGRDAAEYHTESKGLGLAIVNKIVQLHKGRIRIGTESETGKFTFYIEIPKSL